MVIRQCIPILSIAILVTTLFINPTVATAYSRRLKFEDNGLMKKLKILTHFGQEDPEFPFYTPSSTSAQEYALSSPLFLPPFDSLAPLPLPPLPPPQPLSQPPPLRPINVPLQSPPPPATVTAIPPLYYIPSPPFLEGPAPAPAPASTRYAPSPPEHKSPSSPAFLPPFAYPPPSPSGPSTVTPPPPPRHKKPVQSGVVWCVAKPTVPDPIIQEAMDYACSTGADCKLIQPNGPCYKPDTLLAHASYAFNSYWQKTKVGGGTCDFGGTAILVTIDPSFDGCSFIFN